MESLVEVHRQLLRRFRSSMNLVGPGPLDFHFQDCSAALRDLKPAGKWADLGSGAGFPGIVFADLFPEISLDLVDSRRKRCIFLEEVVAAGLPAAHAPIRVLCTRIEDLEPESYDGLVARALAPPPKVLDHARRLLRPNGQVLLLLQDDAEPPSAPDFRLLRETRYTVDGKQRKSVLFQQTPPD